MNDSLVDILDASPRFFPDGSTFEILDYKYEAGEFIGKFRGTVAGMETTFEERVDFSEINSTTRPNENLLDLLALACSLSYYKATLSDEIEVSFPLSEHRVAFLQSLIENGLGEYAYVNNLPWKLNPRLHTKSSLHVAPKTSWSLGGRPLVAVGGGKDSIVTIESLKSTGLNPLLFAVNGRGAINATIMSSGCDAVLVTRSIDHKLLDANSKGAPNGHVPVTAINSLIGLIVAELAGCGPVIFSNEESADYGNLVWNGRSINHQWSKSLEFEDLLRLNLGDIGLESDRYFSLLRSYREIEIAREFSRHREYFDSFTSCNRAYRLSSGFRSASWCGECAKCAFVFLILAPYIRRDRLTHIFGKDLLNDRSLESLFLDILGVGQQKPFDCVGEPTEACEALTDVVESAQWADSGLVSTLADAVRPEILVERIRRVDRVPAEYADARDKVGQ